MVNMKQKKIVVLHRISTDNQDFESQNNAIQEYISKNGIVVDEYIKEEGISGYSNKLYEREAIKKIESMALLNELDTLIVFNLDRIGRTTEVAEFLKKLAYCDVKVYSVTEGLLNGGEDTQDLVNYIKSFSAQMESKKISLRSKNGKEATNKQGLYAGGTVNFGYKVVDQRLVIVPEEAEIVKLIFDKYITEGKNGTVRYLQDNGITKRGRVFSQHMVHDILKDTIYIGLKRYGHYINISKDPTIKTRRYNKESVKYQPYNEDLRILSDDVFYKVQELIDGRSTVKGGVTKYTNKTNVLFEGLLYHRCGDGEIRKLHIDNKVDKYGNKIYSYRCSHCRRNFYKDVRKTYGCKKYNKVLEGYVLDTLKNLSIEEIEDRIKNSGNQNINIIKSSIKSNELELNKKQKALERAQLELEKIFSGDSNLDIGVINNLIIKLLSEIKGINKKIILAKTQLSEVENNAVIDAEIISKYKNFNYAYDKADDKYKKILMQDVVKSMIIDGEELKIELYIG